MRKLFNMPSKMLKIMLKMLLFMEKCHIKVAPLRSFLNMVKIFYQLKYQQIIKIV